MKPGDVWLVAANKTKRPKDALNAFNSWQLETLEILKHHAQCLYQGEEGPQNLSRQEIFALSRRVQSSDETTYRERLIFLAKGIAYGNEMRGWNIPVSPILIKINREKNHITPQRFDTRHHWQSLMAAFYRDLENINTLPMTERLGQLLLCVIFHGGLIDGRWLSPWLQSLQSQQVFQEKNWLWFELERYTQPHNSRGLRSVQPQTRRWLADPLSQLLIYNHIKQNDAGLIDQRPWDLLQTYLRRLDADVLNIPKSQGELLNWAFDRYTSVLPGVLIGYARGDILSTSLPVAIWLRTMTGQLIPVSKPDIEDDKALKKPIKISRFHTGDNAINAKQVPLFREFIKLINPKRLGKKLTESGVIKIVEDFRSVNDGHMSVALQMLLGWAKQLSKERVSTLEGRQTIKPLAPSSVYRYLNEIGILFLSVCDLYDLHTLDPLDLELVYEDVNQHKNSRRYNANRLQYFHAYMHLFHGLPKLDFNELFADLDSDTVNVQANLITPKIYDALLKILGWGQNPDRWQTLRLVATILAYRLGLRPSEIQALRIHDIHLKPGAEVLIRKNHYFSTKTSAGRRRVPLVFLTPEELSFIKEFYALRVAEFSTWDNDLFLHHPVRKAGMLADEELFEPIRIVLRRLTGDESLRFYALRHSFMTLLTTTLMLRDDIAHPDLDLFDHPDFSPQRREQLKRILFDNERCGRKFPQGVAMLAGHNSPKTSYKHYIHTADWLLGYHLRHSLNLPGIDKNALVQITGLSLSTLNYHLLKKAEDQPLLALATARSKDFTQELQHPLMVQGRPLKDRQSEKSPVRSQFLPAWDMALTNVNSASDPGSAGYRFYCRLPDRTNWPIAERVYSAVANQSWQQLKKLFPTLRQILIDHYPGRWGGIDLVLPSKAKKMLELLSLCSIDNSQILVVYHPKRGQTVGKKLKYQEYWQKKLGVDFVLRGEESNHTEVPARGLVTLIITTKKMTPERLQTARRPRMSPGFVFGLDLLVREFNRLQGE